MAIEKFKTIAYRKDTLDIIAHAQEITEEYKRRGFTLTLRQLYYQFVSRDLLANKQSNYKRLGSIIDDARQTGHLDWSTIEDRTRNLKSPSTWESAESILRAVADQYQENPWKKQKFWPEVWIEKDALIGVIEPVCSEFRVPYFACRGYASQSEIYGAGKRFADLYRQGYQPIVFYLGDHDPSGMHMPLDVGGRISLFSGRDIEVRRLALNRDQIDEYSPPPNPAKETDSRFEGYAAEHGDESWELDALDPDVISDLIRSEIDGVRDEDLWNETIQEEEANKKGLTGTYLNFDRVKLYLEHRSTFLDISEIEPENVSDLDDVLDIIDDRTS